MQAIDAAHNRLILGKEEELRQAGCTVRALHWLSGQEPEIPWRGLVQIRSRHQAAPAELRPADHSTASLHFEQPQRAFTPGQFAVFYEEDRVLGSAIICAQSREDTE